MILAIIFVVLGYQRAKAVGKNGFLWAAIAGVVFIGTQMVVGVGIGAALAIYAEMKGTGAENLVETGWIGINLVAIALSILAAWGVLKFIDRTPAVPEPMLPPPPPPTFGHMPDDGQKPGDS
jgi:hypothetical protein